MLKELIIHEDGVTFTVDGIVATTVSFENLRLVNGLVARAVYAREQPGVA